MDALMQEARYAFRQLRRSPGFAAVAIVALGLGIGANTAIFSVVNRVLLRPLPYPDAGELRAIGPVLHPEGAPPDTLGFWSYPMYEAFRETAHGLEGLAAYTPNPRAYNLAGGDAPQRVRVEIVSPSYFPTLRIEAARGRTFLPEEDATPGAAPVALLAHGVWERLYGADPSIVGREITLNSMPFTVVGILPRGFRGLSGEAEVWVPMMMAPALTFPRRLEGATSFWHFVIGRAPADAAGPILRARLAASARSVEERVPLRDAFGDVTLGFADLPLRSIVVDAGARESVAILMGAMGFLLLIVCANLANLLLARAARRRRELGVRLAIGAPRRRVVRQLLVESTTLALLGGLAGLAVALWGLDLLEALAPPGGVGGVVEASLDPWVLAFNFGVAALTGIVIGALPALRLSREDLRASLSEGTRGNTGRSRARSVLVGAQLALSLVLLTGAGLMLKSVARMYDTPLGFEPEGILTANVELPRQAYSEERAVQFLDEASRRLAALPGVRDAGVANCLPLTGFCDNLSMEIRGRERPEDAPRRSVWVNMVDGSHFQRLGIPVIEGRTFGPADRVGAPRVALVNEAAVRAYWPDRGPVGERIQLSIGWEDWAEVVGVVGDVKRSSIGEAARPAVYVPFAQTLYNSNYLVLTTSGGDPLDRVAAVREVVRGLDPTIPLWDVQTMEERIAGVVAPARFSAVLLSAAAALATLLSAVGVFGVVAFTVAGRTREFGLRAALGAREVDVLRLVLRQGLGLASAGLAVGVLGSLALTRVLSSQLYRVSPTDPSILGAVGALLLGIALLATWVPARRAARTDPMTALRHE